ncbi:Phage major capsid protein [Salmonella bongori N268-08]|uniref:Phage major capsid protein n=1 Tax=Salmonella bongori N268-08 TaxID=1197719 RepID=S5MV61_SALBN|nr:Phage major capsid protein [Salmonella bongori N268-08]
MKKQHRTDTKKSNIIGVTDQEGEKVLIDTTGPIARTNSSSDGTKTP